MRCMFKCLYYRFRHLMILSASGFGYTCTWHIYIRLFTTNYLTDRNSWEHFECIGEILSS